MTNAVFSTLALTQRAAPGGHSKLSLLSMAIAASLLLPAPGAVAYAATVPAFNLTPAHAKAANAPRRELVVVDPRVADFATIRAALPADDQVLVIDADRDGVEQISAALAGRTNLRALRIVSHGVSGGILLGNRLLNENDLAAQAAQWRRIGAALAADGDILLYGCDVGAGTGGHAFVQALAQASGRAVAASDDVTGNAARGGDWDLEISVGDTRSTPRLDAALLARYEHELLVTSVATRTELVSAIATARTDAQDDTITLTAGFTLTAGQSIPISVIDGRTLTIVGNASNPVINGGNANRVFITGTTNAGSAITLRNLVIRNGFVTGNGGDSLSSGPVAGGDALGAAISNSGILNIDSVTFDANKAAGGGGGAAGPGGQSGAGGGGGGFGTTLGGNGGSNDTYSGSPATPGVGGRGAGTNSDPGIGGGGGSTTGGIAGNLSGGSRGGNGGAATSGANSIGGGGGGGGNYTAGARGGHAVGVIYNNGGAVRITTSTFSNNIAAGGGGGGGSTYANFPGNGGSGGYGVATIWNRTGSVQVDSGSLASINGASNVAGGGFGGFAQGGGGVPGANRTGTKTQGTISVLPPAVSLVKQTSGDGYYRVDNSRPVVVAVSFDSAVTVNTAGGAPSLLLETGSIDRQAVYSGGTGTSTLSFTYTVQAGDTSADLQYQSTTALALNGGTIKLAADNLTNAALTLPALVSASSLAGSSAVIVDTTAPTAPTPDLQAASDSGVLDSDDITSDTTPTFSGVTEANAGVVLYDTDGVSSLGNTTADASGSWSITTGPLTPGPHTVSSRVTDLAGNTSNLSSGLDISIDTTAPTLAIGSSAAQLKIGETALITFSFSEDPGSSFGWNGSSGDVLVSGGSLSALAGSGSTRTAVFTPEAGVNGGVASISVAALSYEDAAGNGGGAGDTPAISFDTRAPDAPSLLLDAASDSGASNSDRITRITTPGFSGAAESGTNVQLYDDNGATVVGSGSASGGSWSFASSTLADGVHTLNAKATDAAGNVSAASTSLSVTIDTQAAAPQVLVPAADAATTDPTVSGSGAEEGASVSVTAGAATACSVASVPAGGTWSCTSTLGVGVYTLSVTQTDLAGNLSAASLRSYTLQPPAPSAPLLDAASDSGVSATDNITNVAMPLFIGSCSDGDSIQLYDAATPAGSPFACSDSTYARALNLSEGGHTLSVKATRNAATSAASPSLNLLIDRSVLAPVISAPTGVVLDQPVLLGSGETGATVTVTEGGSPSCTAVVDGIGLWNCVTTTSGAGVHVFVATQRDVAGNTSTASAEFPVTLERIFADGFE